MALEIRWAFKVSTWTPSKQQLMTALSSISTEERERIQKFRFKEDFKLSLIGRLMIRRCIQLAYKLPWNEIELYRNEKGKPVCGNGGPYNDHSLFFNVSHAGDYTVLAASTKCNVGIDIMKYTYPNNTDVPSFFRLMRRQFVESEWDYIESFEDDWSRLKAFYRLWCLKESYVKAIGVGIGTDSADTMRYDIKTSSLDSCKKCTDSVLCINNQNVPWVFSECSLDERHIVAVASECETLPSESVEFKLLTFENLTQFVEVVVPPKEEWWDKYRETLEKKKVLPFRV